MIIEVTLTDGSHATVRSKEAIDILASEEDIIYSLFSSTMVKLDDRQAWTTIDKIMYAKVRKDD